MWARLDDELIDHPKIFTAGALLGHNGPAVALGLYAVGLMWCNKHLSDGVLPLEVVKSFPHVQNPASVADALTKAGLWERNGNGFVIHDYFEFGNPTASRIKAKRREDRRRKQQEREDKRRRS